MCFGALWKPLRFTVQVTEIQKIQKTRLPFFGLVCTVPNQFNWSPNTCNASNSGKITKVFEIRPFEQKVLVKTIVNLSFFWQAILAHFSSCRLNGGKQLFLCQCLCYRASVDHRMSCIFLKVWLEVIDQLSDLNFSKMYFSKVYFSKVTLRMYYLVIFSPGLLHGNQVSCLSVPPVSR